MGTSPKASAERSFRFWNDPGRRPRDSNPPATGPGIRAALVFEIRALSRNATLGRAGQTFAEWQAARAHRGIHSTRAEISRLPSCAALGRAKSRALPALSPKHFGVEVALAFLGWRR